MFKDCKNLNYVKMMATNVKDKDVKDEVLDQALNESFEYWLENVADKGTLVINANAKWTEKHMKTQITEDWNILLDGDLNHHA